MKRKRTHLPRNPFRILRWGIALLLCAVLGWNPAQQAMAAVGCSLNDPEGDLRRFFPELTDFTINYLSFAVQDPKGHGVLARQLGDALDPVYETPDVPYTLYTVNTNGKRVGYVFGANQRGTYSNIQIIAVTDPQLKLTDVYLQKIRSPDYSAFQSESFRKNLREIPFTRYPDFQKCYRAENCENTGIDDPSEGRESKDFRYILRGLAKLRILAQILLRPGETIRPPSREALAQWIAELWMPERGFLLIDSPRFVTPAAAHRTFLEPQTEVLVWRHKNVVRIYPLNILSQHPVVHDTVAGKSVAITWSSPSQTAMILETDNMEKGTNLFSNTPNALFGHQLVMDTKTQSVWSPILAEALQGPRKGDTVKQLPGAIVVPWQTAMLLFPHADVLSPPNAYSSFKTTYEAHRERYGNTPKKERLFVVDLEGKRKAWSIEELEKKPIHTEWMGTTKAVFFHESGTIAAFSAKVANHVLHFDRVVYDFTRGSWLYRDRQTNSLWRGLSGEAIRGPLTGQRLHPLVSYQLPRSTWASLFHKVL